MAKSQAILLGFMTPDKAFYQVLWSMTAQVMNIWVNPSPGWADWHPSVAVLEKGRLEGPMGEGRRHWMEMGEGGNGGRHWMEMGEDTEWKRGEGGTGKVEQLRHWVMEMWGRRNSCFTECMKWGEGGSAAILRAAMVLLRTRYNLGKRLLFSSTKRQLTKYLHKSMT